MTDSLKAEIRALMQQKEAVESEIAERMARLDAGPGMDAPLVDGEGYPRADIDVHAARVDRNRVICLSNDHKELMGRIERLMHQLHAAARESGQVSSGAANGGAAYGAAANGDNGASSGGDQQQGAAAAAAAAAPAESLRPLAVVDEVSEDSPASEAGIQLGDQLCRFAGVAALAAGGGDELQRVAAALAANEGREVEAVFLRHGAPLTLRLTPRRWAGRGLLGCHLRPLGQPA